MRRPIQENTEIPNVRSLSQPEIMQEIEKSRQKSGGSNSDPEIHNHTTPTIISKAAKRVNLNQKIQIRSRSNSLDNLTLLARKDKLASNNLRNSSSTIDLTQEPIKNEQTPTLSYNHPFKHYQRSQNDTIERIFRKQREENHKVPSPKASTKTHRKTESDMSIKKALGQLKESHSTRDETLGITPEKRDERQRSFNKLPKVSREQSHSLKAYKSMIDTRDAVLGGRKQWAWVSPGENRRQFTYKSNEFLHSLSQLSPYSTKDQPKDGTNTSMISGRSEATKKSEDQSRNIYNKLKQPLIITQD